MFSGCVAPIIIFSQLVACATDAFLLPPYPAQILESDPFKDAALRSGHTNSTPRLLYGVKPAPRAVARVDGSRRRPVVFSPSA